LATAKKKKTSVKKTFAVKPVKKKTAVKKAVSKSKKSKAAVVKKKTVKTGVKKSLVQKSKVKESKRRFVDVADDIVNEDLESLSKDEIEEELKAYEEAKQKPSPAKAAISASDSPGLQLSKRISQLMFEKKAERVVLADLEGLTSVTDFFVMCTATSDMHARAISDHIQDELEKAGIRVHHKEGYSSLRWVLLDYVDVIAHVFQKDAREFYDLERLWGDAQFIKMKDDASR
jgi:ribosome-associated protein